MLGIAEAILGTPGNSGGESRLALKQAVSSNGETRVRANIGRFESEHNAVAGNPFLNELFRDSPVGAIVLDPNFPVPNINVQDTAVNAIDSIPAGIHVFIMVLTFIENDFNLNVAPRGLVLSVFLNEFSDYLAIFV